MMSSINSNTVLLHNMPLRLFSGTKVVKRARGKLSRADLS